VCVVHCIYIYIHTVCYIYIYIYIVICPLVLLLRFGLLLSVFAYFCRWVPLSALSGTVSSALPTAPRSLSCFRHRALLLKVRHPVPACLFTPVCVRFITKITIMFTDVHFQFRWTQFLLRIAFHISITRQAKHVWSNIATLSLVLQTCILRVTPHAKHAKPSLWLVWHYHIFPHYLTKGTTCRKQSIWK
jgi:hypothetical protein